MKQPENAIGPGANRAESEESPRADIENLIVTPNGVKEHGGWFACFEQDFREIERVFDEEGTRRKAKAAYVTLHRVANLRGKSSFSAAIGSLARDMDYSVRHAGEALHLLEVAGLVKISANSIPGSKLKAPSTYSILRKVISMTQNGASILPPEKKLEGPSSPITPPRTTPITSIPPARAGETSEPGPAAGDAFRKARMEAGLANEGGSAE